MEVLFVASVAISVVLAITAHFALRLYQKLWVRPKKMEEQLRKFGFKGNPYRFLHGDMKDYFAIAQAAISKPINFSHDIGARVLPYEHHIVEKHGKNSFVWFGAKPRLNIMDPLLVKEILVRQEEFHKVYPDPVADFVAGGLSTAHSETWLRHRKIINPAFNVEKLKGALPELYLSCKETISKWKVLVSTTGTADIDVWPSLEILAHDMISRAAFGSFYEEGRRIFQLHEMQADLAFQFIASSYI
ncbi:Secologanin synthase-like protein [Heracleum sosnowskyi]|uniref:Secologanin synthase-like protein n=1 Tax=Heracleum sosnowskyi TaxID=360622 RepID=A0AAD8JIA9_9APIA|nr:Secologanin synthase-like protein [Heracleum sosnowskyi]